MDFPENRRGGNCDRILSRGVLCQKDHETETRSQSCSGWHPDNASCSSAYSGRLLPAAALQSETAIRKLSLDNFDIKVVQTWTGCVIAAAVIAFPLMYRNARAAFEQVDVNLIYAGQHA